MCFSLIMEGLCQEKYLKSKTIVIVLKKINPDTSEKCYGQFAWSLNIHDCSFIFHLIIAGLANWWSSFRAKAGLFCDVIFSMAFGQFHDVMI